jgi:hypothetical protein
MKLRDYIELLKEVEEEYGGDLEVIYSADDEGNSYDTVNYSPGVGRFAHGDEFRSASQFEDDEEINAVCIN